MKWDGLMVIPPLDQIAIVLMAIQGFIYFNQEKTRQMSGSFLPRTRIPQKF